ncbi:hypothetical protein [Crenothrix sp.]|uniref:hypothetical protein n=1 Tax=Crenothrix sp. TaxID=3100433 RepID=UPI00374D1800
MNNVIDLNSAVKPEPAAIDTRIIFRDEDGRKKTQSTILIEIGKKLDLFHCPNGDGYAIMPAGKGQAIFRLKSSGFNEYLSHEYFKLTGKGCNTPALTEALSTLEAEAKFNNPKHDVFMRVSKISCVINIDIGCSEWQCVNVTANGWQLIDKPSVKFTRRKGAASLPVPSKNGNAELLKQYINADDDQFPLILGWLLCALGGVKPFPVLILQGEQGTGKSTTSKVLRSLVDPSTVPLRNPPKDIDSLLVSACNNYMVVLDNLSGLSPELSDALCRLSTGGGIDKRQLYSDGEQFLIEIQRPVLINGIDDIATRPDLAERSIIINLPVIEGDNRRSEEEFWTAFEADKPHILGGLLDLLALGLANYDSVKLPYKPRMADMAKWTAACEVGTGYEGEFMKAHSKNQTEAVELGIEASPAGSAIMALMDSRDSWTGSPNDLMSALEAIAGERQTRSKAWPQSTKGLSNIIKRLMPGFRKLGLSIEDGRTMTGRFYKIKTSGIYPSYPSYPSLDGYNPDVARVTAMTDSKTYPSCNRHASVIMTDSQFMTDSMTDSENLSVMDEPSNGAGLSGGMTDMTDMTLKSEQFKKFTDNKNSEGAI